MINKQIADIEKGLDLNKTIALRKRSVTLVFCEVLLVVSFPVRLLHPRVVVGG
jgi:hypothetical protein